MQDPIEKDLNSRIAEISAAGPGAAEPDFHRVFESYGMRVRIESDRPDLVELGLDVARTALVGNLSIIDNFKGEADHVFGVFFDEVDRLYFTNEGVKSGAMERDVDFRGLLNAMIRVHVAEKARGWVFIHSGVVGYRGKAILVPGRSHSGKTTLVSELISLGAEYYSDEFAVLDADGMIHPFPRDLAVRPPGSSVQIEVEPKHFGASVGSTPIPVGMVLLTMHEPGADFRPETVSLGVGIIETVPDVIPIRFNTDFSLKVLNTAFRSAIILKSLRGEAHRAAPSILSYLDNN